MSAGHVFVQARYLCPTVASRGLETPWASFDRRENTSSRDNAATTRIPGRLVAERGVQHVLVMVVAVRGGGPANSAILVLLFVYGTSASGGRGGGVGKLGIAPSADERASSQEHSNQGTEQCAVVF